MEPLKVFTGEFGKLRNSTGRLHALKQQRDAAATTMATLNEGKRNRRYKVGQRVSIYLPARELTEDWKPKHCQQFVGPMVVTRKDGTCYTVEEVKTGKSYERTVGNIAPYPRAPHTYIPRLGYKRR